MATHYTEAKLSQESLERLAVAVILAKDDKGCPIALRPRHVLQDWVLRQFPKEAQ
jgi:hypothetical protein